MKYYTINEVAEQFGVTRAAVYKWMAAGQLRYVIVGKHRRITERALADFVREVPDGSVGDSDVDEGGILGGNTSHHIKTPSLVAA